VAAVVPDASAILAAYLPDELQPKAQELMRDYSLGAVDFFAPRLLTLELLNACLVAQRRARVDRATAQKLAQALAALNVVWVNVEDKASEVFAFAEEHGLSAYDASYAVAARVIGCRFVTGDARLYRALAGIADWVTWLGDYPG
jgi:predicted nucleic acid-binding protein